MEDETEDTTLSMGPFLHNGTLFDADPFELAQNLPGTTIREKLRYWLAYGMLRNHSWADMERLRVVAIKFLYAAMLGFQKEYLTLLYLSGEMGDTLDELLLTKVYTTGDGPSVRDRCCGHVFQRGETYFRCKCPCR
jgi:hypothetical protein